MRLLHRAKNPREFHGRYDFEQWARKNDPEWAALADEARRYDSDMAKQFDAMERPSWRRLAEVDEKRASSPAEYAELTKQRDNLYAEWNDKADEFLERWKAGNNERAATARAQITKTLKEQGYDALRIEEDAGSFGRNTDTLVVLDPAMLRSPNARFDPAKRNSRNILAGLAPLGIGAPLAAGLYQPESIGLLNGRN
jgi:thiamine pyrophosphate-dependent acetolactate synthase large subunit-like protein